MGVKTFDMVQRELIRLHDTSALSWRDIAALDAWRGIPAGSLCSMYHGWEPKTVKIRRRLGLSAMVPAPACARCGEVHVSKRCVKGFATRPYRDLWDWPGDVLKRAMEERKEMN